MLHLQPVQPAEPENQPYAEAVSRLASIRHALRLVNQWGGGPADDRDGVDLSGVWAQAGPARQRLVERQSEMTVHAAAAGLEALLAGHTSFAGPNVEASRAMVDQIRRELEDISTVVLRPR